MGADLREAALRSGVVGCCSQQSQQRWSGVLSRHHRRRVVRPDRRGIREPQGLRRSAPPRSRSTGIVSIASRMDWFPQRVRRLGRPTPRCMLRGAAVAAVGMLALVGGLGLGATPASAAETAGAGPVTVVVHNGDPVFGIDVSIDGEVRVRRVPPDHNVSLVVDPGPHVIDVVPGVLRGLGNGSNLPAPPPVHGTLMVDGRSLSIFANATSIIVTSGTATTLSEVASPGIAIAPGRPVLPWRAPASLGSILAAALCLATITGGVIAHLMVGRSHVRDERTRLRMQQLALRSLNDLPRLTIGIAARRGATERGAGPSTSPGPPRLKSARARRPRADGTRGDGGRVEVVRGGRVAPSVAGRVPALPVSPGPSASECRDDLVESPVGGAKR